METRLSWAEEEFKGVSLGDKRLDKRLVLLAEQLGATPTASIPAACGGWAETQAAYRFFDHEKIEWSDIMEPHRQCAIERMRPHNVVLCIQDTTEINFNGQNIAGLGPLSYESQRGMYVHPTLAVTPLREPLGILDAWMWARELKDADGIRGGIKESLRWIEGYQRIAELAPGLPETRLVYVADREADILELMVTARDLGQPVDWLIRSKHNRSLPEGGKLWGDTMEGAPLGQIRFTLPMREGEKARDVTQQVWVRRLALPDGQGAEVMVSCIVAQELNAPRGVKPVEWRLLTNREVVDLASAIELIDWYRTRWEIEMFFNVLKNGCKVEALQLETIERLMRVLAVFMVIAWRISRLVRLGRTCPDLPAELLFEKEEWQAAYILNKKRPPDVAPSLNAVVRMVAMLGGFLGRKGDGEPGTKTLWLGLQRVTDFVAGLVIMRELQAEGICV